jgi:hypothetical protein
MFQQSVYNRPALQSDRCGGRTGYFHGSGYRDRSALLSVVQQRHGNPRSHATDLFDPVSRDGGEIYACCNQAASGIRIHHNWLHDTKSLVEGEGDSYALSGIGLDNGSGGFDVDQNVLWNNAEYNILINGVTGSMPNNNHIQNNTIPDSSSHGRIGVIYVQNCTSTRVVANQLVVKVGASSNGTACTLFNNDSSAPGATEMSSSTQVGCNFAGCSSNRPPAIVEGGDVTPCPISGPQEP